MNDPDSRTMTANGLRHRVLVWNDDGGPTVVCCHGFLDQALSFDSVAKELAGEGYRVVAFDWRGHGQTEHVGGGGYYHFPDYVLDLHELMPFLVSEEVHLVGHSMGGTATALYTATHPNVPKTLTLIEGLGPPASTQSPPEKMRAWLDSVDRIRGRAPRPMSDLADAVKRMRVSNPELPTSLAYELAEAGTREDEEGLLWRFDPLHRTTSPATFDPARFAQYLAAIPCPTLIVTGTRGFRTADHETRVAALADAREVIVEDVGHMIHQLAPERLAGAILEHIRQSG
ncbi:MAG: alpha/beta fold hydrolase [Sandaracinaceae bacterium]